MGVALWDKLWQTKPELVDDANPALGAMLARIPGRNVAVLAGDQTGQFAETLSDFFKDVYVFESNQTSYCGTKINTARSYNVYTSPKALSSMTSLGHFIGNKLVDDQFGRIHMTELDALRLEALDVLVIDNRQDVGRVLAGASGKIIRFLPVILIQQRDTRVPGYLSHSLNGEWVAHIPRR